MSAPVEFYVGMSNEFFTRHPYIKYDSITGNGFEFALMAAKTGRMWAIVVKYADRGYYVDGSSIPDLQARKYAVGNTYNTTGQGCGFDNFDLIAQTLYNLDMKGCDMISGGRYTMFVYIDSVDQRQDGVISTAVDFYVPLTNMFFDSVNQVTKAARDYMEFKFKAARPGKVWAIVTNYSSPFPNPALKLPNLGSDGQEKATTGPGRLYGGRVVVEPTDSLNAYYRRLTDDDILEGEGNYDNVGARRRRLSGDHKEQYFQRRRLNSGSEALNIPSTYGLNNET
jgi:hypothetical protein